MANPVDHLSETAKYNRIFRWLGLCIDYFSQSEEEEDQEIVAKMRKDPVDALEALVEIRMSFIAYRMKNVTHSKDGNHDVSHAELNAMIKKFPPKPGDLWWKVWLRYFEVIPDIEWINMWIATDLTIEEILAPNSNTKSIPPIY